MYLYLTCFYILTLYYQKLNFANKIRLMLADEKDNLGKSLKESGPACLSQAEWKSKLNSYQNEYFM